MKTATKKASRKTALPDEPSAFYVRNTEDLRALGLAGRVRALAKAGACSDVQVLRGLLLLGLAQAEADRGALAIAAERASKAPGG